MAEVEKEVDKPKIVFKRHAGGDHGGHHGGAWKIAYADFVTAMMAFFLLMWLLASVGKHELEGISEYFNRPISAAFFESGASSSVLQGGGTDAVRNKGEIRKGDPQDPKNRLKAGKMTQTKESKDEEKKFKQVAQELKKAIEKNKELQKIANQIKVDITTEGLRIQIVDEQNRPMFQSGSAQLQSYTISLIKELSDVIKEMPNKISISGHTDSTPYSKREDGYSNWELSADRANAARRELIKNSVDKTRIKRVVGLADSQHLNPDRNSPENRRISIILMTTEAEKAMAQSFETSLDINQSNLPGGAAVDVIQPIKTEENLQ